MRHGQEVHAVPPATFPWNDDVAFGPGMEGKLVVGGVKAPAAALPPATSIVRAPTDLPGPLSGQSPRTVAVELEAVEVVGKLANETTYNYWTFNGKVPGPFLRVRVGDTDEVGVEGLRGRDDLVGGTASGRGRRHAHDARNRSPISDWRCTGPAHREARRPFLTWAVFRLIISISTS